LTSDTPRDFCKNLLDFLSRETGINWQIKTQVSGGGQTLFEQKEAAQNALVSELKQTPTVSAVLSAFSGAKVEKVKPVKTPQTFDTDTSDTPVPNSDWDE
jgi:hypothetical protein